MIAGAIIDGGYNAISQTGQIDARQVFDHAVEGAVIGGGVVIVGTIAVVAVAALIPTAAVAESAACADGDCTNEARSLVAMGEDALKSPEAKSLIRKIAEKSTVNSDSPIVSLGRWKSETENYTTRGFYTYFDVPDRAAEILGNKSPFMRAINDQFMENQMTAGKDFAFSLLKIGLGGATLNEYNRLISETSGYVEIVNKAFDHYFTKVR